MKFLHLSILLVFTQVFFAQTTEKTKKATQPALRFAVLEIERQDIPYGSEDLFVFEFKNTSKTKSDTLYFGTLGNQRNFCNRNGKKS